MLVYFRSVFFFKQKTAYEMRISDWSSDVCSSDLNILTALLGKHLEAMVSHAAFVVDHAEPVRALGIMAPKRSADLPQLPTFREQGIALDSTVWGDRKGVV